MSRIMSKGSILQTSKKKSREGNPERKIDKIYGIERFAKTREEFISYYNSELEEKMNELEQERTKFIQSIKQKGLIFGIILVAFILLGIFMDIHLYIYVCVLFGAYLTPYIIKNKKEIQKKIKANVVQELVTFMNPNFTYEADNYIPASEFNKSKIFKKDAKDYTGDDLIKGYVWDEAEEAQTNLAFSEVKAVEYLSVTNSKGETQKSSTTIFHGLFFKVDFNKDFGDSTTIIAPRGVNTASLIGGGSSKSSLMKEVHLEDPAFMEKFIVHSDDQINARVILQADTMRRLLDFLEYKPETITGEPALTVDKSDYSLEGLKKAVKIGLNVEKEGFTPYFSFRYNHMYFLINTDREHFSFGMFKKLNIETIYEHFKDTNRALRLIDDLNLNLKVYKE